MGDAGCTKDPITAQGISDAFQDAELCSWAVDQCLCGARAYHEAMSDYQRTRDVWVLPIYDFTTQLATLEPAPPVVARALHAASGNPSEMDALVSVFAGTVSPDEFFAPERIGRDVEVGTCPNVATGDDALRAGRGAQ